MFYVDSQRTVTRRESSLIANSRNSDDDDRPENDLVSTPYGQSSSRLRSESTVSGLTRPWGSVRKEIITSLFENMLGSIVESWDVIAQKKVEDFSNNTDIGKTSSEVTVAYKKKKPGSSSIPKTKSQKSRSKMDVVESGMVKPLDILSQSWWSSPDEKAIIRFKNGNMYEGNISMKCMHGEGRFQWADGTTYLGQFNDNEIRKGLIHWKNDTWYDGDFIGNLRHGKGLYVDSRTQSYYAGSWHCGTKHGKGVISYSEKNSYDGDWVYNVRHGYGVREYCAWSGYKGEWNLYVRDGKGMMIWSNHDFYRGQWRDGVMHGYGLYVWDAHYNNTMSVPTLNIYRGLWNRGLRNGYGHLNLGLGLGSRYEGNFTDNKKNGSGTFVTNNGLILREKNLFHFDNLGSVKETKVPCTLQNVACDDCKVSGVVEQPYEFKICDDTVGLIYHVEKAVENFDRQEETRAVIINEFIYNNSLICDAKKVSGRAVETCREVTDDKFNAFMKAEENALRKALRCYETHLKNIYYTYATICNTATAEILFTPVLIRLYLWQFYYDLDIHKKGLTLVQIDRFFHENKNWLSKSPHFPFEKIYFWQFLHNVISVARKLYAKNHPPGPKPDSVMASAFTTFMETDVLPGFNLRHGRLAQGYGLFMPLMGLYELYRRLGEPHTIRTFLCAVRRPCHHMEVYQPDLIDAPDEGLPLGSNVFVIGDELSFTPDDKWQTFSVDEFAKPDDLPLFNFGNLSSKTIINIFAQTFPHVARGELIVDLEVELTFYEFFEAFVACSEESIRVKDEEMRWREEFSNIATDGNELRPNQRPSRASHVGHLNKLSKSAGRLAKTK